MWKYNGKIIREGSSWANSDGIQHPPNWHIWSKSEKEATALKREVQAQQYRLLADTDWAVIRKADKGTAIPSNIQTYRDAIRTKATAMENAIDGAANTDAVAALFVTRDKDGNKSGILYDWPELGS